MWFRQLFSATFLWGNFPWDTFRLKSGKCSSLTTNEVKDPTKTKRGFLPYSFFKVKDLSSYTLKIWQKTDRHAWHLQCLSSLAYTSRPIKCSLDCPSLPQTNDSKYQLMSVIFKNNDNPQLPFFSSINTLWNIVFVKLFYRVFRKMLSDMKVEKPYKFISMNILINAPVSLDCPSLLLVLCPGILTWGNCLLALRKAVKLHWATALIWENFIPKQHLHKHPQPQSHIKRW